MNNITAGTQEASLLGKQVTFGRTSESKREKRCSGDQDTTEHGASALNISGREALDSVFNLGSSHQADHCEGTSANQTLIEQSGSENYVLSLKKALAEVLDNND